MAINRELLEQTYNWLRDNPEVHAQGVWADKAADTELCDKDDTLLIPGNGAVCGTRGCLAGWGLIISGGVVSTRIQETTCTCSDCIRNGGVKHTTLTLPDGTELNNDTGGWREAADEAFGLTGYDHDLYDGQNTLEAIRREIDSLYADEDAA